MTIDFGSNLFPRDFEFSDQGKALMSTDQEDSGRTKTRVVKVENRTLVGDGSGHTPGAGKVWFLTNISISSFNDNAAEANASAKVNGESFITLRIAPDSTESQPMSFPFPIKVNAGEVILASNGSSNVATAVNFVGWEENA